MRGIVRALLGLGLLGLLAVAWRAQSAFQFASSRAPGGWWLLAATVTLAGLWLAAARRIPAQAPPRSGGRGASRAWLGVAALCGLGVLFRIVHFSTVPAGMNHDAAFNGMYALHVLQGAPYTPYVSAAWGRETLFMYLCTPLVAWLGNVPEPIQIAATLVGIATLPIFYLFARPLCGRRVALIALAFFAVSGWHVVFSRVGWRMIMVAPFEMLALLGLWRGLERGARRDWLLCGAGAALAIYTYDAGRAVPVMVAVLFALFALIDRRRLAARLLGGAVALATFLIVGGPMLWYAATHFEQFKARAAHLAEERTEEHVSLTRTALTAAGMFNYRGNGNDFFIDEPLLEPLAGVLFAFGTVVLLVRIAGARRSRDGAVGDASREPAAVDTPGRGAAGLFVLAGLALALLPGVLSVPNGNRCIGALPFVYVIIGLGADALATTLAGLLTARTTERVAAPLLVAVLVVVAGAETYGEFLGPQRRTILGFSPEGTAGGEYLRRFDDQYNRYVIAEDWPEYTLDYLSYNGGGTPLEPHYLLGRRLEDIEGRINRYGRKGLVFVTDLKPAGREALERLQRLFAEHRIEPVTAPRLGGAQVATALIVEPQGSGRSALWANATRALSFGGDQPAAAVRCFDPVGDGTGVSLHFQLMRPRIDGIAEGGEVRMLTECPPKGPPTLTVGFGRGGLEVRANHVAAAVDAAALEAGRWYEIDALLRSDGSVNVSVDGHALAAPGRLVNGARPPRIAGFELRAPAGGQTFVDDVAIVPGIAPRDDPRWDAARRRESARVFGEDFEATPYGLLAAGGEWQRIAGPVSALASPAAAASHDQVATIDGGNAFDGGRGAAPGQFDEPVGIAVDPTGNLFIADKNNHRIQKFARDGSFVRTWGQEGNQPGQFREPHDVAADAEFVYVADTWNQRIQVFDRDGAHVFNLTGEPSLSSPRAVFVKDKLIYIAEAGAGQVSVYDRAGKLQRKLGTQGGDAPGHLIEPVDVAVDPHGDVWVVNSGNNRLERFAPDGTPRGAVPIPGWSGAHLKEVGLAIDADGTLYMSDWDRRAVRRFRPDGSELAPLGSEIREPSGVSVERDRVLVVSRAEDVVRVLPLSR